MNILRSLPIWPIHSCNDKFINAKSGILLPYQLPFFSFQQNNFYKCDELDFNALFQLDAESIDELEYVTKYFIPQYIDTTPSQDYITFLQSVLSLGNHEIEQYFGYYPLIPNKSLEKMVMVNTLYDITIPLFCTVYEGTNNFLPTVLNNQVCVSALRRIGLKYQVNSKTFIECAKEIESQFQQPDRHPMNVVRHRARSVMSYLYEHFSSLHFSADQLTQILQIKFVPSERDLQSPLYEEAKETLGFESFETLCFPKYKEVCWTQRPLFERNVEPTGSFYNHCPGIGEPSPQDVINHWFIVVDKIKSKSFLRSSENYKVIKRIIKEIYEIMNKFSQKENLINLSDPEKKIFLNGDDLFDYENWMAGSELVLRVQGNVRKGLSKVHESLIPYENLLRLFGALKLEEVKVDDYIEKHNQKDLLASNLLNRLIKHPNTKHHDVIFIVGEERSEIGANRYVLSGELLPHF
jgi:hypothetical protein